MGGRWSGRVASALVALAVVVGGAASGRAAVHVHAKLLPTAHAPKARGQALLQLRSASNGRLKIAAQRLAADTSFDVVADGVKVGTLTTNGHGTGKTRLSTAPHGQNGFLGFDPRGTSLAVRDGDGDDVLEGDMDDGSVDPNAVACCLAGREHDDDDGDVECEERTADACTAAGGTVAGPTSCLPDPCGGVVPPGGGVEVTCCLGDSAAGAFVDDDPEVECHRVPSTVCANAGGTVVTATSCEPNPCQPVPPPTVVVCCVSEHDDDEGESEVECELRTPEHCSAHGGTVSTATSCDPNPCPGASGGNGDGQGQDGDGQGGSGSHDD
jgi:hypothetical protein